MAVNKTVVDLLALTASLSDQDDVEPLKLKGEANINYQFLMITYYLDCRPLFMDVAG